MKDSKRVCGLGLTLLGVLAAGCATGSSKPSRPLGGVMASKLDHAQGALVAVMQADYPALGIHARALEAVSTDSLTLPQDTMAYGVLADRFRTLAGQLATEAEAADLDGVTTAYIQLTQSCVACHQRVNRERELGTLPHKVSMLDALSAPTAPPEPTEPTS